MEIDFGHPILPKSVVEKVDTGALEDFYGASDEVNRLNLFFVLLTSLHHYEDIGDILCSAHLCFLIAYYLFTLLTPPGSWELAMNYMKKAVSLKDCSEYREWLSLMQKGN